jgi:hypothetical protein
METTTKQKTQNAISKFLLALLILASPTLALAQVEELVSRIGNLINFALSLLIPISIIAVVIAGYQYLTSGGSSDQMKKAQTNLTWIIVGMIVIIFSKGALIFILSKLGINYSLFGLTN